MKADQMHGKVLPWRVGSCYDRWEAGAVWLKGNARGFVVKAEYVIWVHELEMKFE